MTDDPSHKTGQCRCGEVKFAVTAPVLLTMACHCKGCQRMTASAFSLSAMYAGSNFEVTAGEPVLGGMKAFPAHFVCPHCSSWVFTRVASPLGEFVNVRSTMLDEPINDPPFIETCTADKLSWVEVKAAHSFDAFPPREEFSQLIATYMEAKT